MSSYNEKVKYQYRDLVRIAVEHILTSNKKLNKEERDKKVITCFIETGNKYKFTERDNLPIDWIRKRLYRPDLCEDFPLWTTKTALMYLVDNGWKPDTDSEWFISIAIAIRIYGKNKLSKLEIYEQLPVQLKCEKGLSYLESCLISINNG